MNHVFVSYIRENSLEVERLRDDLMLAGIDVWLDRESLEPGSLWKEAIRKAIQSGGYFLACFSQEWNGREKTYMNEELVLAIDEIRQRPFHSSWFIPIKLNPCDVPDRDLGGGLRLYDLQWLELYKDWKAGVHQLLNVIEPLSPELTKRLSKLNSSLRREKLFAAEEIYNKVLHWPEEKRARLLPILLDHLYDSDAGFTYYIVKALGRIHHEKAFEALVKALDDPWWHGHTYKLAEVVEAMDPFNKVVKEYEERKGNLSKHTEWIMRKRKERGA